MMTILNTRPEQLIGRTCGFRVSECGQQLVMAFPFADGSFPDGFIEATIVEASDDKYNREIHFVVQAKHDPRNRQDIYIHY